MTKKRIIVIILCVVVALACFLPFVIFTPLPTWDSQVKLTDDGVTLTLTKVDGAKEYKIYHSPSRYGEYQLISTQTGLKYTNEDKYGYYRVDAVDGNTVLSSELLSYDIETFGDNMRVYAPMDDRAQAQAELDAAYERNKGKENQFTTERFAAVFKAGEYNELDLKMSYYTTFAGLGKKPTEVQIGGFNVYAELDNGNATCNFWRGIENMSVNGNVQWAVSQATSFRRMQVNGDMTLIDAGESKPWGSGGFIADTAVTCTINAGGQQQWLTRNSKWREWKNGDMNLVFVGSDMGSPIPTKGVNNLDTVTVKETPIVREKPFLVFDNGYYVCLPDIREETQGVSWLSGNDHYTYIPLEQFYVARADRDTAKTLNAALKNKKHIFFTPGIYKMDSPLLVKNKNTILMGNGLATLQITAKNRDTVMRVSDVDGVKISGLLFDAGAYSKTLLEVGEEKTDVSHAENPIFLSDLYFRIGGAVEADTKVLQTLVINANDVVGDNFWVWRADHTYGVAWEQSSYGNELGEEVHIYANETVNGAIINGDNVTVYGLMVEHFHKYQTIWNGENGFMAFYQSETPYVVPSQEAWSSHNGTRQGWASYKVSDHVQKHTAYGIGVYHVRAQAVLDRAIELPANQGIYAEHMVITGFSTPNGAGIRHIVNEYGKSVIKDENGNFPNGSKTQVKSFIAGVVTE